MKQKYSLPKVFFILLFLFFAGVKNGWGQVYFNMSSSNFTENFTGLTSGSSPTGSWKAVPTSSSGSIPSATNVTVAWATFSASTSASGSVGVDGNRILFLSTGTSDNSTSVGLDLNLNFSNRKADSLTFNVETVNNSTGK